MPAILNRRSVLLFAAVAVTMIAVACGGGDDKPAATSTPRPATPTATTPAATATTVQLVGDATRGEALFASETCSACHSTGENRIVGPGLKGVAERAAPLGGDAYLIQSIKDPLAVIAPGFTPGMSDFSHLDDQKVADLVAYLNTLN